MVSPLYKHPGSGMGEWGRMGEKNWEFYYKNMKKGGVAYHYHYQRNYYHYHRAEE